MSARRACAPDAESPLTCPNCGGDNSIVSNLIDEAPYIDAARPAAMLRHLGATHLATDLLTSLASVRIINFVRMKWRCSCGATFDE